MKKLEVRLKDGTTLIFDDVESFREIETVYDETLIPTEGKLYEVNMNAIYVNYFEKPRRDKQQEWVRKIIRKAFEQIDKYPEKYGDVFYTLIPEKNGNIKTVEGLETFAQELGGERADWVHQAMEWAHRICNNENWEKVCNDTDTAKLFRVVSGIDGDEWLVGGARAYGILCPASEVTKIAPKTNSGFSDAVPLVVFKSKDIHV